VSGVPDPTVVVAEAAQTPYALLGGDAAVRALVERFYDLMELEPRYAELRALHAADLTQAFFETADWMRNRAG